MTELTKWPRLLVVGDDVTAEQANEILVRTNSWYLHTNDRVFERAVLGLAGIAADVHGRVDWDSMLAFRASIRHVDLHHLDNQRIMSSWIGGPHGWCDWDGRIGCSTYNVGKWPGFDEVTDDWLSIAAAFPYLRLSAQLVTYEGEGVVAGQWSLRGGAVTVDYDGSGDPPEQLREADDLPDDAFVKLVSGALTGRERGVTLDRLRQAIAQVRAG